MLKLKLQYFNHLMWTADSLEKTLMLGKDWRQEEKGMREDEMAGWHHQLLELTQTYVHRVDDAIHHLILCHSLLLLTSIFPSIRVFSNESSFASGGQRIGASASASVLPMYIQDWFPLGWTGLISLQSKGLSRVFSNTTFQKLQFFGAQLSDLYTGFSRGRSGGLVFSSLSEFSTVYCDPHVFVCITILWIDSNTLNTH